VEQIKQRIKEIEEEIERETPRIEGGTPRIEGDTQMNDNRTIGEIEAGVDSGTQMVDNHR